MAEDANPQEDDGTDEAAYIENIDAEGLVDLDRLTLTPAQHEQLKSRLHAGDGPFTEMRRSDRRYLVVGRGDGEPGERRTRVQEHLDARAGATAVRLEDFGFTGDELELWAPAFDILAAMATHVVGVLEDFDGGHVWELGYLYRQQARVRDILWLLKRVYGSEATMRERYDNGMAASHLAALESVAGDRVIQWADPTDLIDAIENIP